MQIFQIRLWLKYANKFAEPKIPLVGIYAKKYLANVHHIEKTVMALLTVESWKQSICNNKS